MRENELDDPTAYRYRTMYTGFDNLRHILIIKESLETGTAASGEGLTSPQRSSLRAVSLEKVKSFCPPTPKFLVTVASS